MKTIIESYLKERIRGYKKEGGAWFTIVREDKPDSTRFGLHVSNEKREIKIYDRKEDTTKTIKVSKSIDLPEVKEEKKDYESIFEYIKKLLLKGEKKSHKYIEKYEAFIPSGALWRVYKDQIVVPYTDFELNPKPCGAKLYPMKKCVKGSIMKGSFHPHSFLESNRMWVLGEGFKECMLAGSIINDANSLEVGGCSNMQAVIDKIPKKDIIYVMGENDTKEFYNKLQQKNTHIKVTFPSKGKDFADEYLLTKNLKDLKLQIMGSSIKQSYSLYKPLGVEGLKLCVYSKITKAVHKIRPDKKEDVLRVCLKPSGWELLKKHEREEFANKVFAECVRSGDYMSDSEYGKGLWEYNKNHYYNTGSNVYKIGKNSIKSLPYEKVLNNDFLLTKCPTEQQYLPDIKFDKDGLEKAIMACDWDIKAHGALLIGFMIQAIYAGSIDFRPTLWIMSDASTAGKSWITNWIKDNILITHIAQEGGKTSSSGLRQDAANHAAPVFIDEFGEKESQHAKNAKQIIEMLRTAVNGKAAIKLGTPDQTVIKQRIRFSAVLSCIDGLELLEEQDYERTIFIRLLSKNKEKFFTEVEPQFKRLEGNVEGFTTFALKNFHLYKAWLPQFLNLTVKHLKGHRFKGLASILCGYAIYKGSVSEGFNLYKKLRSKDHNLFSPYHIGNSQDILDKVLNKLYSTRYIDGNLGDGTYKTIKSTLKDLGQFGIKANKEKTKLFINPKLAAQFFNLIKFEGGWTPEGLTRVIKNSKFYRGTSSNRFDSNKKSYCFEFSLKGLIGEDE